MNADRDKYGEWEGKGREGEGEGEGKGEGEGEGEAKKHPNAFHGTLVWGMRKEHSNSR